MKNGYKETYKGYHILLWYDTWVITNEHGLNVCEIPTWQSPYLKIDELLGEQEGGDEE